MPTPLLHVERLTKHFAVTRRQGFRAVREMVRAVDGVDLTVGSGSTVGLVGESGCGKSTLARAVLRLTTPTSGSVWFDGSDMGTMRADDLRRLRSRLGIVFQDPMSALNPRMTVGDIVAEPLRVHGMARSRREARDRACALLDQVGLRPDAASRYPHEFSGGQRQRIGIARAIATEPSLIVLDEPISALDLSIRAQILNLLADLQERLGMAYLLIAHDLSVVRHACDLVSVMYLGVIVESGPSERVFAAPMHPYTRALLASAPVADPSRRIERAPIEGDVPSPTDIPAGCRFRARCPIAQEKCAIEEPVLRTTSEEHAVACHYA